MVKKRPAPTIGLRLSDDEKNILDAYGDATGQARSKALHEVIKAAIPHMAAVIVRADIARDLAAPGAADWTPTLPDAAKDRQMRLDREARERKAAQKA
jgi:predicted DNA-binding protein